MPWDDLTDEQRELRDLVRTLARERIAPRAAEIDATHEFPWDVVELFRDQGIFGLLFDELRIAGTREVVERYVTATPVARPLPAALGGTESAAGVVAGAAVFEDDGSGE